MMSRAMASKAASYVMVVDNPVAKENVTRYAMNQGYKVAVTENDGEYTLNLTK